MTLGVVLPEVERKSRAAFAAEAESLGYESVWLGELWGENSLVELAKAAENTSAVRLGTAITNVYSRSPAVLAMGANSLDRISGGRFVLGVGVSTPKAVEDLHGMSFERPIRRVHETVELVNGFTSGEGSVNYDGEIFTVADFPSLDADVPVYNAALGPANRRVTGRLCDGWLPNNIPFSNMADAFRTVAEAARERGRDPDGIERAPWIHVAASDDDPEMAVNAIRKTVAYYVGSADGYKNAVGAVYREEADRIAAEWRAGNHSAAADMVTDEMVGDLGCAGTIREAREQLYSLLDNPGIDLPIVDIPDILSDEATERTFQAVAPES